MKMAKFCSSIISIHHVAALRRSRWNKPAISKNDGDAKKTQTPRYLGVFKKYVSIAFQRSHAATRRISVKGVTQMFTLAVIECSLYDTSTVIWMWMALSFVRERVTREQKINSSIWWLIKKVSSTYHGKLAYWLSDHSVAAQYDTFVFRICYWI